MDAKTINHWEHTNTLISRTNCGVRDPHGAFNYRVNFLFIREGMNVCESESLTRYRSNKAEEHDKAAASLLRKLLGEGESMELPIAVAKSSWLKQFCLTKEGVPLRLEGMTILRCVSAYSEYIPKAMYEVIREYQELIGKPVCEQRVLVDTRVKEASESTSPGSEVVDMGWSL